MVRRGEASLAPVLAGEHSQLLEGVCRQLAGRGARGNVVTTSHTWHGTNGVPRGAGHRTWVVGVWW